MTEYIIVRYAYKGHSFEFMVESDGPYVGEKIKYQLTNFKNYVANQAGPTVEHCTCKSIEFKESQDRKEQNNG